MLVSVPLELPAAHGRDAVALAALEVVVPPGLAAELTEVPPDPREGPADEAGQRGRRTGRRAHRRPPTVPACSASQAATAAFSSLVAMKEEGATIREGTGATSVVGSGP